MLFGAEYRKAVRRAAVRSNAKIAGDVAAKRAKIAEGKRNAREYVKRLQAQLAETTSHLKGLTAQRKASSKSKAAVASAAGSSLALLTKLKETCDLGLLTEQEYEEKRRKLVSQI